MGVRPVGQGSVDAGEEITKYREYIRSLIILAARPHDHIRGRRLRSNGAVIRLIARRGLLEEAHDIIRDAAHVAARVRRDDTQQALAGLLGEVGLLEDALGRVDVGQVERGAGVARVEDGGQAHAGLQGGHHDAVHLVVDDVAHLPEVDGVDDFVVAVGLVAVEVFRLSAVSCRGVSVKADISGVSRAELTRVVEEERVIGSRVLDEPMHGAQDILFRRLAHGVLQVVGEDDHVLALVAEVLEQVRRHVLDVVDAAPQLPALPKVVDPDQQRLAPARAVRVLEGVVLRRSLAEALRRARGWWGGLVVPVHVGVRVGSRDTCRRACERVSPACLPVMMLMYLVCHSRVGSAGHHHIRRIVVEAAPKGPLSDFIARITS
jgi:hypothetical protein